MHDLLIGNLLFNPQMPQVPLTVVPGRKQQFDWICGHGINESRVSSTGHRGPLREYEVAIVGKCLNSYDVQSGRLFAGKTGSLLGEFLEKAGLGEFSEIYLTNLLKTTQLLKAWKAKWVQQQATFLRMELLLTRPKYVLALGSDVCKYFLGRSDKMSDIEGRWFDVEWDIRDVFEDEPEPPDDGDLPLFGESLSEGAEEVDEVDDRDDVYRFKLLPCMHPAALEYASTEGEVQRIQDTFTILAGAVLGTDAAIVNKEIRTYPIVRNIQELRDKLRGVGDAKMKMVAVDAEWQGKHPQNAGSYLRCVQFCWETPADGTQVIVLHLTDTAGNPDFIGSSGLADLPARREAFATVLEHFEMYRLRVAGYFFPADLEWLTYFGLDILPYYEAADSVEECRDCGGFALELAVAAVDELARNDLDSVRWRFTKYPVYEHVLKDYVKREKTAAKKLAARKAATAEDKSRYGVLSDGYGWIPDEILYPYAGADVVVTLQATFAIIPQLDRDRFGMNCWLPYFNALGSSPVAAEIMQVGLPFDSHRCLELAVPYANKYFEMVQEFQELVSWPGWSPDSPQQVVEVMYGTRYSTKRDSQGTRISVRPPGAKTLAIVPALTNDNKSPQPWTRIVELGQEDLHTPGTNGKTIGVLSNDPDGVRIRRMNPDTGQFQVEAVKDVPGLTKIRDMRTLGQLRKTFIGKYIPPEHLHLTKESSVQYVNGLVPFVCDDGYVRSFISQVKETGRWSASRPNLHAMPKRKEAWYKRIMGDRYPGSVRSAFKAPPGYIIMEADYKTAELFMLALAAGDTNLWHHCQCSLLPDDHPDFVDIHSKVAVTGLQLQCAPTKRGLAMIDKEYLRDVAKCYAAGEFVGTECGWLPVEKIVSLFSEGKQSNPIQPGKFYLQSDDIQTPLLAVHSAGEKDCFSIRSACGYELVVSADHESFVLREGDIVKVKTSEILPEDYMILIPRMTVEDERPLYMDHNLGKVCKEHFYGLSKLEAAKSLGILAAVNLFSAVHQQGPIASIDLLRRAKPGEAIDCVNELRRWVETVTYSTCGDHLILAGEASKAVIAVSHKANWFSVPDDVFMWGYDERLAFAEGVLSYAFLGTCRRPVIAMKETDEDTTKFLRKLQQLLLSLGYLTRRTHNKLEAGDQSCLDWWCDIFRGERHEKTEELAWGGRLPGIVHLMRKLLGRPPSESCYHTREEVSYYLTLLRKDAYLQSQPDVVEFADRISEALRCGYYFDKIESVKPVGVRPCYDVQTSRDRNRAIVSGGVLSSNSIVFGWAYGRQPPAIVIGAKEEGIIIDLSDAEAVVSSLYKLYPLAAEYLENASHRVSDGFLCTPMGRWRRTPDSQDRKTLSAYEREFKNAPIQGGVADVVNIAGRNLRQVRKESGIKFWIAMQIHDAFIFLVPVESVEGMVNYVIPEAMSRRIPIIPRRLDGSLRTDLDPKYMSVDMEPYLQWGIKPKDDDLLAAGVDPAIFKGRD